MAKHLGSFYAVAPLLLQRLLWAPTRLIFRFFCKLKVYGRENLKQVTRKHGTIFVANHASELDPPLVNAALHFTSEHSPLFFASDEPRFFKDTKKFGWRAYLYRPFLFRMLGAYPIFVGRGDYEKALPYQLALLEKGESLLFFPEGKLTPDGMIQKAKPGIGFLLHRTDAVIVPIAISGTFNVTPKSFLLRKHDVVVRFGRPIRRSDIPVFVNNQNPRHRDYKATAGFIMERIEKLLK